MLTTTVILFLIIVVITKNILNILHENYTNEIANRAVKIINKK